MFSQEVVPSTSLSEECPIQICRTCRTAAIFECRAAIKLLLDVADVVQRILVASIPWGDMSLGPLQQWSLVQQTALRVSGYPVESHGSFKHMRARYVIAFAQSTSAAKIRIQEPIGAPKGKVEASSALLGVGLVMSHIGVWILISAALTARAVSLCILETVRASASGAKLFSSRIGKVSCRPGIAGDLNWSGEVTQLTNALEQTRVLSSILLLLVVADWSIRTSPQPPMERSYQDGMQTHAPRLPAKLTLHHPSPAHHLDHMMSASKPRATRAYCQTKTNKEYFRSDLPGIETESLWWEIGVLATGALRPTLVGETGDLQENQPTNGIILHDFHMRKPGNPARDGTWFPLLGGEHANCSATLAPRQTRCQGGVARRRGPLVQNFRNYQRIMTRPQVPAVNNGQTPSYKKKATRIPDHQILDFASSEMVDDTGKFVQSTGGRTWGTTQHWQRLNSLQPYVPSLYSPTPLHTQKCVTSLPCPYGKETWPNGSRKRPTQAPLVWTYSTPGTKRRGELRHPMVHAYDITSSTPRRRG
ncbi:hypothetical protein PR048_011618 [Dryococelus australis]|uniref:HNH nuclease domain-containing protein n=1 Tax=Dryococelus australis TaxID=614101 RepID=A0ABQ9HM24_9NEOP|nr:hypothetical protein PR048_011618 [Dryococelus australis]